MSLNKENTAIFITPEILKLSNISLQLKVILSQIVYLCNNDLETCTAGNEYFMKLFGKSKGTIQRWIRILKRLKLVNFRIKKGVTRVLTIPLEQVDKLKRKVKGFVKKVFSNVTASNSMHAKKHDLDIFQYEHESLEEFEARCQVKLTQGNFRLNKKYLKNTTTDKDYVDFRKTNDWKKLGAKLRIGKTSFKA